MSGIDFQPFCDVVIVCLWRGIGGGSLCGWQILRPLTDEMKEMLRSFVAAPECTKSCKQPRIMRRGKKMMAERGIVGFFASLADGQLNMVYAMLLYKMHNAGVTLDQIPCLRIP